MKRVGEHYRFVTEVAHHKWARAKRHPLFSEAKETGKTDEEVFAEVVGDFENVLFAALRRQLDAHTEIDQFVRDGVRDARKLHELLDINFDSRQISIQ